MIKSDWHGLKDLEKDGLRVPTVFELIHLRKNSDYREGWFWSSSPYAVNSDGAWDVSFHSGYVGGGSKSNAFYVRLVRAGQSFDYWHPVTEEEVNAFRKHGVLPDWHPPIEEAMVVDGATYTIEEVLELINKLPNAIHTLAGLVSGELVAVPKEPTEEMISAALKSGFEGNSTHVIKDYRAMLEAAQDGE